MGTFTSCENPLDDINESSLDELAVIGNRSSLKSPKTTVGMSSWGILEVVIKEW